MADRSLVVHIVGDDRSLQQSLNRSTRSVKQFENQTKSLGRTQTQTARGFLSGFGGKSSLLFGSGAFIGSAAVTAALKSSITEASNLNEEISKSRQVFGQASSGVEKWSETTASSLGIARSEALKATGTFGNLFRVVELGPQQAAQMSQALVQLAADLASFNNASPDEVLTALRSGLIGEAEPLRRFGVLLSETRVQQQALIETGKSNVKNLTDQEKVQARYNLILEDTRQAQGDVARTSGSFANQSRQLDAQIQNLAGTLGSALLPVLTDVVTVANNAFGALDRLGKVEVLGHSSSSLAKNFFKWTNPVILQARAVRFALDQVTASADAAAAATAGPLRPDDRAGPRGPGGIQAAQDAAAAVAEAQSLERAKAKFAAHMKGLGLKLEAKGLTKTLSDDIAVLREMERAIHRQIAIEGRTFELAQDLVRVQTQLMNAGAKAAEDGAKESEDATKRITEAERRRRKNQREQFEKLGLTVAGEDRVPGAGALKNRTSNLQKQIKGTVLDTEKTRGQLARIARILSGQFGKVGRDVRQPILGMLNDITEALNGGPSKQGPLTKSSGLNTNKLLAGLGLSPEQIRELRGRLSGVNSAGKQLAGPGSSSANATGGFVVESHTTINLDGQKVTTVVTKQQQKAKRRNPQQKRGPNRNR